MLRSLYLELLRDQHHLHPFTRRLLCVSRVRDRPTKLQGAVSWGVLGLSGKGTWQYWAPGIGVFLTKLLRRAGWVDGTEDRGRLPSLNVSPLGHHPFPVLIPGCSSWSIMQPGAPSPGALLLPHYHSHQVWDRSYTSCRLSGLIAETGKTLVMKWGFVPLVRHTCGVIHQSFLPIHQQITIRGGIEWDRK